MKILFDQGTPVPLRQHLAGHSVSTAFELGWSMLENGDLLISAEQDGFELLISTDSKLRYQQNLAGRRIAILVLLSASWPRIRAHVQEIQAAIQHMPPSGYAEVAV